MQYGKQLADCEYQATADQLIVLRNLVRGCLEKEGFEQDFIQRMVLAVNEACMNIIQHAYANRDTGIFRIEMYSDDKELTFCLTDFAPVVDKKTIQPRNLDDIRPGGLGVHFINELMDCVEYLEAPEKNFGNKLQMKKKLSISDYGI